MNVKLTSCGAEVSLSHPEGYIYQAYECGDFDEWAYDPNKSFARIEAEDGDSDRNRQFEVVACGCEGQGGRLRIVRAQALAHPEADQKHDEEVDHQRDGDPHDI